MNPTLTLAVAMTTYNGEKYLPEQLESLVRQTRLPDEMVVCDDVSTDGTLAILQEFAASAPFPVRILQNTQNVGSSLNFWKVFSLVESDVTFFCDQDDVWAPEKIASAAAVFESEPEVELVLMDDLWVDAEGKPLFHARRNERLRKPLEHENTFRTLFALRHPGWAAHSMAVRTVVREKITALPLVPMFDNWLFWTLGATTEVRVRLEPLTHFRRHGGNVTSHSGKERNPFKLFFRMLRRRQDVQHFDQRIAYHRRLAEFLQTQEPLQIPEIQRYHTRIFQHLQGRRDAIAHPLWRPWLVLREIFNGNYFAFSKGIRNIFSDLLAWPPRKKGTR